MKLLPLLFALLLGSGIVNAATLEETMDRFLKGEKITAEDVAAITNRFGPAIEARGMEGHNGGWYLNQIKISILDPVKNGGWPLRSRLIWEPNDQKKTYEELKAIYDKNKTPIVAYALVCPALLNYKDDLLPELVKKIAENEPLKKHFDAIWEKSWKPRLVPDL